MCGIVGILSAKPVNPTAARRRELTLMSDVIAHRGPDDADVWLDAELDIGLAHRRLSIVDLSPLGRQPMASASGRYLITFNGEIYNFRELRAELESVGAKFRGTSDTEVLLAAIDRYGPVEAVKRCVGMFAIGLWDREARELWLFRDRFGEKPLYFSLQRGSFIFASELRSFLRCPRFSAKVSRENLPLYLRYNYYPADACVFEDMRRLPPGHYVRVSAAALKASRFAKVSDFACQAYWSAEEEYAGARSRQFQGGIEEATKEAERLLDRAIRRQMIADVPVGAFLSGGIDSSLVVALMARATATPVQTFTIGYREQAYNEAHYAKKVAAHIGTNHHELEVHPKDAMDVIERIGTIYDEPFADQSQIPTLLVSRAARAKVTVALTGDGGDELFGGYNRHVWVRGIWNWLERVPRPLRDVGAGALGVLSSEQWDWLGRKAQGARAALLAHNNLGLKVQKLRACMSARHGRELYARLASSWDDADALVVGKATPSRYAEYPEVAADLRECMMFWDTTTYLPGDILTKVDRASMAVSLETRAPFLDHEFVHFIWSLPTDMKIAGTTGKLLLRRLLSCHVPTELFDRPKQGFGIPIAMWLRGPLKEWGEALLDRTRLAREGWFEPEPIRTAWRRHQEGEADLSQQLWSILIFQNWLEQSLAAGDSASDALAPQLAAAR